VVASFAGRGTRASIAGRLGTPACGAITSGQVGRAKGPALFADAFLDLAADGALPKKFPNRERQPVAATKVAFGMPKLG
jgi:hypothetical protein